VSKYQATGQPCPKCNSSDSMAVYQDGSGYCFSNCGYINKGLVSGEGEQVYSNRTKTYRNSTGNFKMSRWNVEEVNDYPLADLSHRGITREAVQKFSVRQAVKPESGDADRQAIFYPSGKGSGFKRKNALIKKDIELVGDYSGLFGQQVFPRGGKFLVITEGEEDALAMWQAFKSQGKDYTVCSLPNGAGCGGLEKKDAWDYITSFEGVLLVLDNDDQGREGVEKFASLFATEVKLKVAELPEGCKDANDCIKAGKTKELVRACFQAKEYQPELIIPGSDVSYDLVREAIKPGYMFKSFPEFSKKLGGLRDGELGIVMAPPGVGKSTWVAELGYELIKHTDEKVAWMFLEEDLKKATQRLIAIDNNTPLPRYRLNPSVIPEDKARSSYDNLINNGRTWFIDLGPSGRLNVDRLLHMLRYYRSQGVKRFIFDHISILFSHDQRDNERKLIDNVLSEVAAFCAATGSSMVMVAHIRRIDQHYYHNDEVYGAKWLVIDPASARGSGSFEQLAFWIAALEPEKTEDEQKGRVRINIKKNREWGFTGPTDVMKLNQITGRLEICAVPEHDY